MKIKPNYIIIPLIALFTDVVGSMFTATGLDWYKTINIPPWTPPGYVIGSVWITIFILTSISAIIVWNNFERNEQFKLIIGLFIANVFLNVFWSYLFFYNHLIQLALIEMIVLLLIVFLKVFYIYSQSKLASSLLLPYIIWLSFATFLTFNIYNLN